MRLPPSSLSVDSLLPVFREDFMTQNRHLTPKVTSLCPDLDGQINLIKILSIILIHPSMNPF